MGSPKRRFDAPEDVASALMFVVCTHAPQPLSPALDRPAGWRARIDWG
jgi:hypothetical protein